MLIASAPANPCLGHIFQIMMALKASFWLCVAPFRHRWSRAFFIRLMQVGLVTSKTTSGMMLWRTYSSSEPVCTCCHPFNESATGQNFCCCTQACLVHVEISLRVLMILRRTCPRKILHNSLPSGPIPFKFSANIL